MSNKRVMTQLKFAINVLKCKLKTKPTKAH